MNEEKLAFLQTGYIPLVSKINADTTVIWGKMNAQQMVEHVAAFFKISSGKLKFPLVTPIEHLPKYREFLFSDIPFKPNTKAPVQILTEETVPVQEPDMPTAINMLQKEVDDFIAHFKDDALKTEQHPVFGDLNFEEWVLLNHKHVVHHLKQFGVDV